jgi:hypothetical protein
MCRCLVKAGLSIFDNTRHYRRNSRVYRQRMILLQIGPNEIDWRAVLQSGVLTAGFFRPAGMAKISA